MTAKKEFTAVIQNAGGGGMFVNVPFDVEKEFGSKRPKIVADIDGEPYRGLLVRMGSEQHMLLILKEIREKIGKSEGDKVRVAVQLDTAPRVVELPSDFAARLSSDAKAQTFFETLSFTHRKEYVKWIEEAKREETRSRRLDKAMEMLRAGKKERSA